MSVKEVELTFDVSGTITQVVEVPDDMDTETLVAGLKSHRLYTSLEEDGDVTDDGHRIGVVLETLSWDVELSNFSGWNHQETPNIASLSK